MVLKIKINTEFKINKHAVCRVYVYIISRQKTEFWN